MPYEDFAFSFRAKQDMWQFSEEVLEAIDNKIVALVVSDEPCPAWTTEYTDGHGGIRKFEISCSKQSVMVCYNVDRVGNVIYVTSISRVRTDQEKETVEIRFFSRNKQGRLHAVDFLIEARATGPKGFAHVVQALVMLAEGNLDFPLVKSVDGYPGLSELRPDFGDLCYRIYFGYLNTGKVALLLGGIVKTGKNQPQNQRQIKLAFQRLKIAETDLDGNSVTIDHIPSPIVRSIMGDLKETH